MLLGYAAAACRAAGAGNSGSRVAHSASVTDDGYTAQPCPPAAWGRHDGHGGIGDDVIVGSWCGRGLGTHRPNQEPSFFDTQRGTRPRSRVLKHPLTYRQAKLGVSARLRSTDYRIVPLILVHR